MNLQMRVLQDVARHEVISQFGMAQEAHQNPASKNRRLNVSLLLRYSPPDGSRVSLPCLVQQSAKHGGCAHGFLSSQYLQLHWDQRLARRCSYRIMWCWWYQNHLRVTCKIMDADTAHIYAYSVQWLCSRKQGAPSWNFPCFKAVLGGGGFWLFNWLFHLI